MKPENITVGVVGLGLMGSSITTCLLIAGHPVVGVAPVSQDVENGFQKIQTHLHKAFAEGVIPRDPSAYLKNLTITEDYTLLGPCEIVVESTLENLAIKDAVFKKIEAVISKEAILASNTSAIPISTLQKLTIHPERFFGLHWCEPAHLTRFLEIVCGDQSDIAKGEYLYALSNFWQKEPILVRKDIAGFISNRLMYALYRESMSLVENGYATVEDVDRACRNNAGYWMTLVGAFRWMDLTGIPAYATVMKDLLPTLNNSPEVPKLISDLVQEGAQGVSNAKGFHSYTPQEAALWQETFTEFSFEIRKLALKYPADVVKQKLEALHATQPEHS